MITYLKLSPNKLNTQKGDTNWYLLFYIILKKVCVKLNFSKVADIYNKRKMNMKNKQQQFINAWESFLNDVPDTKPDKQDAKNDLTFTEACLIVIIMALLVFMA